MKHKIKTLERTGTLYITEWKGYTVAGERIYIKYKKGWFELFLNSCVLYESGDEGDTHSSVMSTEEMKTATGDFLDLSDYESMKSYKELYYQLLEEIDRLADAYHIENDFSEEPTSLSCNLVGTRLDELESKYRALATEQETVE